MNIFRFGDAASDAAMVAFIKAGGKMTDPAAVSSDAAAKKGREDRIAQEQAQALAMNRAAQNAVDPNYVIEGYGKTEKKQPILMYAALAALAYLSLK